jgi:glycyl-tRNA synthetase (class II)
MLHFISMIPDEYKLDQQPVDNAAYKYAQQYTPRICHSLERRNNIIRICRCRKNKSAYYAKKRVDIAMHFDVEISVIEQVISPAGNYHQNKILRTTRL